MENTELKVGDRVRLTGWSEYPLKAGFVFPIDTTVRCGEKGTSEAEIIVLDIFDINWFTFEKLPDETQIP